MKKLVNFFNIIMMMWKIAFCVAAARLKEKGISVRIIAVSCGVIGMIIGIGILAKISLEKSLSKMFKN